MNHHKPLLATLALLLLTLTLAACGDDPTPTPPSPSTPLAQNTKISSGDPQTDLLVSGAQQMKSLKSYHLDLVITASGQNVNMGVDVDVATKNMHMTTGTGSQSFDIIVIGATSYTSADGGKTYTKSPVGQTTGAIDGFVKMWTAFDPSKIPTGALKEGSPAQETIDGVQCNHLTAKMSDLGGFASGGSSGDGTVEMWISNDSSPTVRQMKTDTTTAGQRIAATLKWSKFNQDLGIEAPPTK